MRTIVSVDGAVFISAGKVVLYQTGEEVHRLEATSTTSTSSSGASENDSIVLTITTSPCGKYIFAGYSDKSLLCWEVASKKVIAKGDLKKRACGMVCGLVNGTYILSVLEKSGDIYSTNALKLNTWVLMGGHTASVITDMAIIHEGQLIATADRDEKIRISQYPETYHIVSYCMGHKSVVSSLCEAVSDSSRFIVSAGWDHKLCVWEASKGSLVNSISTKEVEYNIDDAHDRKIKNTGESGVGEEEKGGEEEDKNYDSRAAGEFPNKLRHMRVNDMSLLFVSFNESCKLGVYILTKTGTLQLVASFEALANILDFTCVDGGKCVLLLPGSSYTQEVQVTTNKSESVILRSLPTAPRLLLACEELKIDFAKQEHSLGDEGNHTGGGAIKEKHVIKRSFQAMMRGEPGTFERNSKGKNDKWAASEGTKK